MENWGLITCRTSVGLWDESSGLAAKKYVVAVQAHELAHQWFGNIVTSTCTLPLAIYFVSFVLMSRLDGSVLVGRIVVERFAFFFNLAIPQGIRPDINPTHLQRRSPRSWGE